MICCGICGEHANYRCGRCGEYLCRAHATRLNYPGAGAVFVTMGLSEFCLIRWAGMESPWGLPALLGFNAAVSAAFGLAARQVRACPKCHQGDLRRL